MANRKLRLVIADDSEAFLRLCEANLNNSPELADLDYEVKYYLAEGKTTDKMVSELKNLHPDELVIDHSLGLTTGKEVVDLLRRKSKIPVIYATNYSPESLLEMGVIQSQFKIQASMTGLAEGSFDAFFNKDPDFNQNLAKTIRSVAYKPIDLSFEGIGKFNSRLIEECSTSPVVRFIKFHSSTKDRDDIFDWCEESEEGPEDLGAVRSKLVWCDRLEDLLDTDILAVATVSLSPEKMQQINYSNDRREFFPYERERFLNTIRTVKEVNPNMPIINFSNPVAYILEFARRLGLKETKLFSPCEPDTSRLRRALYFVMGDKAEAFIKESGLVVAGVHGDIRGVYPLKNTPFEIFLDDVKKAEERANEAGKKSQIAAIKLGLPYFLPQKTNFPSFEDLAHYRQFPISCHTHWDYEWKGRRYNGYAAGPVKTSWKGGIEVMPDFKAVERIHEEFYSAISPMLETQRLYLNEQLGKELTVN